MPVVQMPMDHFMGSWRRPRPLQDIFKKHSVVLVGDDLGAFYLDRWATAISSAEAGIAQQNPFPLWKNRNLYEAKVGYMEFVYAASEQGVRDVVIDMESSTQKGINDAMQSYNKGEREKTTETIFYSILHNTLATPMDAVLQMASTVGIKVHALNTGLSGIATLFREAKGILTAPPNGTFHEKYEAYIKTGFETDKITLNRLLRRQASQFEINIMREQMLLRLSDKREETERAIFNEKPTFEAIKETVGNRPFLGFFQNGRLFQSFTDLDGLLRTHYGDENVARLSMISLDEETYPKPPQYDYRYSMKGCTVSMTETYVQEQNKRGEPKVSPSQEGGQHAKRPNLYVLHKKGRESTSTAPSP